MDVSFFPHVYYVVSTLVRTCDQQNVDDQREGVRLGIATQKLAIKRLGGEYETKIGSVEEAWGKSLSFVRVAHSFVHSYFGLGYEEGKEVF